MREIDVVYKVVAYLSERGYNVITSYDDITRRKVMRGQRMGPDIIARRGSEVWIIEAKGDPSSKGGEALKLVIGQIVSQIDNTINTHYGIAISEGLARYLRNINAEWIRKLDIALFVVCNDGHVVFLSPKEFETFMKFLHKEAEVGMQIICTKCGEDLLFRDILSFKVKGEDVAITIMCPICKHVFGTFTFRQEILHISWLRGDDKIVLS